MPRAIVKQPNGQYAIWSSVVDDFIIVAASAEEAIVEEMKNPHYENYPGGRSAVRRDLCREMENIHNTGRAWKWAPTWDDAIDIIRELHGDETADERIRDALEEEE